MPLLYDNFSENKIIIVEKTDGDLYDILNPYNKTIFPSVFLQIYL